MTTEITTSPAWDICKPANPMGHIPFRCSLVCCGKDNPNGGMGWPMSGGLMSVSFYAEDCYSGVPRESFFYAPGNFNVALTCPYSDSVNTLETYTCTWTGYAEFTTFQGTIDGVPYGYKIRISAVMTAIDFNTVSASFTMQRLAAGSDFIPAQSGQKWVTCGVGSGTCHRVVDPGVDPNDKQTPRIFVSAVFPVGGSGYLCGDAKYAKVSVILTPARFGCQYDNRYCAFPYTGQYFSCLRAVVIPTVSGIEEPSFAQIGVNRNTNCGQAGQPRCGCVQGELTGPGYGIILPMDQNPGDLLAIGCPGEIVGKKQQIQYGESNGYDVIVKSIEGTSSLCVACRQSGNPTWTLGTLTEQQDLVPWIASAEFPTVYNSPKVLLYGLKFPVGAIGDCIQDGIYQPPPTNSLSSSASVPGSQTQWWKICDPYELDSQGACYEYPLDEVPSTEGPNGTRYIAGPYPTEVGCFADEPPAPSGYRALAVFCGNWWKVCSAGINGGVAFCVGFRRDFNPCYLYDHCEGPYGTEADCLAATTPAGCATPIGG